MSTYSFQDFNSSLDFLYQSSFAFQSPKAFDNSKVIVANNIKGYPGVRMISNLYSRKERVNKFHGVEDFRDIKHQLLNQGTNPIPPRIVDDAPVHEEVLIPGKDFDHIHDIIPVATHTFDDGGQIFGAGSHVFMGEPWVPGGGSQISMYRMSFREGQKYASINMVPFCMFLTNLEYKLFRLINISLKFVILNNNIVSILVLSSSRNNVIKFGKHWIELCSDDGYDLLCGWCWNTINEVDNNIFYNIDGR